ncbi:STAS domain-containing protein [Rhodococcus sp. IEGM 1343]|jgi:anti-anti-sigma factor|uniref:STAS domain-containing protein n=1 Tax=Rhodococcus sp. IEGM 1343 TaxID=3082224 RepID=UPI0009664891|nr:STAS domain-containing protein [Rhodococcus sp. IEGM 1343]MDV8056438.1 STAS domain-containing protein [Rhodococcus sp. IEGM 1343]OLT34610.1 anti-anti-sigma factor [Rhodococcus sp. CUA-806]
MTIDNAGLGPLDITVTRIGTATVLSVRGELDLVTSPYLRESIDAVFASSTPTALIVDLTDVPFLASVGMGVLVDAGHRVSPAQFAVVADGPATRRPLMLVGVDQTVPMYTDLQAAVAALLPGEKSI